MLDKLTLTGLVIAFGAIFAGQWLGGGHLSILFNTHAFLIVVGGTLGAVMIQSPWRHFAQALKKLVWMIIPPDYPLDLLAVRIQSWGMQVRQQGFLTLEHELAQEHDPFCRQGLILLIDGAEASELERIMEQYMDIEQDTLERCARIYESMGGYSPTIGILGAVLGLIQAMSYLATPDKLGGGIAVAFVATIYGVGFANLLYLPIANKLRHIFYQYSVYQEMLIAGLVSIAHGESSISLERRMNSFMQEPI